MRIEITEDELVTRTSRGTSTVCRMCYDLKGKIILIEYVADGHKILRWSVCDRCQKAINACPTCPKEH